MNKYWASAFCRSFCLLVAGAVMRKEPDGDDPCPVVEVEEVVF